MARSKRKTKSTASSSSADGSYEVGFAKPPKEHQFKPGKSGNRKGRPPGSVKLATIMSKIVQEPRAVSIGGRKTSMSTFEVMIRKTAEKAVGGDTKAFNSIVDLLSQHNPELLAEVTKRSIDEDDIALLQDYASRQIPKPTPKKEED